MYLRANFARLVFLIWFLAFVWCLELGYWLLHALLYKTLEIMQNVRTCIVFFRLGDVSKSRNSRQGFGPAEQFNDDRDGGVLGDAAFSVINCNISRSAINPLDESNGGDRRYLLVAAPVGAVCRNILFGPVGIDCEDVELLAVIGIDMDVRRRNGYRFQR